jgi:hypothetical protein
LNCTSLVILALSAADIKKDGMKILPIKRSENKIKNGATRNRKLKLGT